MGPCRHEVAVLYAGLRLDLQRVPHLTLSLQPPDLRNLQILHLAEPPSPRSVVRSTNFGQSRESSAFVYILRHTEVLTSPHYQHFNVLGNLL